MVCCRVRNELHRAQLEIAARFRCFPGQARPKTAAGPDMDTAALKRNIRRMKLGQLARQRQPADNVQAVTPREFRCAAPYSGACIFQLGHLQMTCMRCVDCPALSGCTRRWRMRTTCAPGQRMRSCTLRSRLCRGILLMHRHARQGGRLQAALQRMRHCLCNCQTGTGSQTSGRAHLRALSGGQSAPQGSELRRLTSPAPLASGSMWRRPEHT